LFEANASLEPVLRESQRVVAPHARMRINIGCLSDREGESRFEVYQNDTGKSHLSDSGSLIVPNIVLDDYLRRMALAKVRLLKLDIEGQELAALHGAKEALDFGLIDFVYCEIRSELLARYGRTPIEVVELFSTHGFKPFFCRSRDLLAPVNVRLDNDLVLPLEAIRNRIPDGTDILAIHRSVSITTG
jgi:FkbM family methyltransferase